MFQLGVFMFSFKNSTLPSKFNNFFSTNNQIRNYNTRSYKESSIFSFTAMQDQYHAVFCLLSRSKVLQLSECQYNQIFLLCNFKKSLKNFFSVGIDLILPSAVVTSFFVKACTAFAGLDSLFFSSEET